jgi:hypothetical protein
LKIWRPVWKVFGRLCNPSTAGNSQVSNPDGLLLTQANIYFSPVRVSNPDRVNFIHSLAKKDQNIFGRFSFSFWIAMVFGIK